MAWCLSGNNMSILPITSLDLKVFLDEKVEQYNNTSFIETDPISVPHLFSKKEDIEIAAFFAATLAWGQRSVIIRNAKLLMEWMDYSPHQFILNYQEKDLIPFQQFKHRTFNGDDCVFFIQSLHHIYKKFGTLEKAFEVDKSSNSNEIIKSAIINFRTHFFQGEHLKRTQKHVSNPLSNSACKRLNMLLRWMVRHDNKGVDFGIWKSLSPADLLCPLDIHTGNTGRKLKLIQRKQNDWKTVEELSKVLNSLDSEDPVKYDYALFGLGVFEKF